MSCYINVPFLAILYEGETDMERKDDNKWDEKHVMELVGA
jgi:hypothetical protein